MKHCVYRSAGPAGAGPHGNPCATGIDGGRRSAGALCMTAHAVWQDLSSANGENGPEGGLPVVAVLGSEERRVIQLSGHGALITVS